MTEETTKKRGRPPKAQAEPATVPLLLKYPTWDMDGERHEAGETVPFPVDVAKTLISAGKAERNDPFPGD